jgi:hypothetical protein
MEVSPVGSAYSSAAADCPKEYDSTKSPKTVPPLQKSLGEEDEY